jgi:hypothetical protein
MRFAGEAFGPMPRQSDEDYFFGEYNNPANIQVNPSAPGLAAPIPTSPAGEIAPEFQHPLMDPFKGPSYREKWQFKRLMDPSNPAPLL